MVGWDEMKQAWKGKRDYNPWATQRKRGSAMLDRIEYYGDKYRHRDQVLERFKNRWSRRCSEMFKKKKSTASPSHFAKFEGDAKDTSWMSAGSNGVRLSKADFANDSDNESEWWQDGQDEKEEPKPGPSALDTVPEEDVKSAAPPSELDPEPEPSEPSPVKKRPSGKKPKKPAAPPVRSSDGSGESPAPPAKASAAVAEDPWASSGDEAGTALPTKTGPARRAAPRRPAGTSSSAGKNRRPKAKAQAPPPPPTGGGDDDDSDGSLKF
eukprot:TRINITY_DN3759_c0_g2_i1.p1 TRINITY_DN3759_c0_g2~~TRINITY_DN3759_c0_g2_i1.p1  ORF type:complete len:267 (+),score=63.52 TRINITY_DN3759_c0_g2_i1:165-965(+)